MQAALALITTADNSLQVHLVTTFSRKGALFPRWHLQSQVFLFQVRLQLTTISWDSWPDRGAHFMQTLTQLITRTLNKPTTIIIAYK